MASALVVVFTTADGQEETKTFTKRPLGMEFIQKMPIVVNNVKEEAAVLGVQKGWTVKSVGGESFEVLDFEAAFKVFKKAVLPLKQEFVVRECPVNDSTVAGLALKVGPVEPAEVPAFLKRYGYTATSSTAWEQGAVRPEVALGVIDGHREKGLPYTHTWYALEGRITVAATASQASHSVKWQVERRLAHLRAMLHCPVKEELGKEYDSTFAGAHFAHHAGPPGTTARLEAWLCALAKVINNGKASPGLVALTMRFLEAPDTAESQGTTTSSDAAAAAAAPPEAAAPEAAGATAAAAAEAPAEADAPREKELDEKTDDGAEDGGDDDDDEVAAGTGEHPGDESSPATAHLSL